MSLRRRLASAATATALFGAVTVPAVALAPVAAAHSVLVSISPEDGSQLEESPETIELTFNEEINQNFATVAVTSDADNTNLAAGDPVVDGETVSVEVDELQPGAYTVGYRVTSADGHVVSGSSVFTVAGSGTEGSGSADQTDSASTSGDETGGDSGEDTSGDQTADVSEETSGEQSGINPAIWVVGGLAIVLLGGAFVLLRRGK